MTVGSVLTSALLDGFDLTDLDNFAHGFPHDTFAVHRRLAPVLWHDPAPHTSDGEGFWSVATHAETLAVARDPRRTPPSAVATATGRERSCPTRPSRGRS